MAVMEKLKMFVVNEPIVAASCLIGGVGTFIFKNPSCFCYFFIISNLLYAILTIFMTILLHNYVAII
ncbi:hypothetical protein Hanom_Chr00s000003g01604011 [Helianthus anomalus]